MHPITSGQLLVNCADISKLKGKSLCQFRRNIGIVFQSFNLVKRTTVPKNDLTACVAEMPLWKSLLGLYSKEDVFSSLASLDQVGILDKAYSRADQLSGGQQRVALARCLAQDPKIILADESVASLDPVTTVAVMDDFVRINEATNITVIINIHHIDLALNYAKPVIGIRAEEVVYDGPSSEVSDNVLGSVYGRELAEDEIMVNK